MIYRAIGKAVVKYGLSYAGRRYRRQIRVGLGAAVVAVGVAVYLANRDVPEG